MTAVVVPVVVVLVVLVNVLGGSTDRTDRSGRGPAEIDGTVPPGREDLPVLPIDVPQVTPEAETHCPDLMAELPLELNGEASRRVQSDSPFAYAWGQPPIVLLCGVERPAGWVVGTSAIQINGVQWYVDTSDADSTVWTTVDRPVHIRVSLPASVDSAPVTVLSTTIGAALAYVEPTPAG